MAQPNPRHYPLPVARVCGSLLRVIMVIDSTHRFINGTISPVAALVADQSKRWWVVALRKAAVTEGANFAIDDTKLNNASGFSYDTWGDALDKYQDLALVQIQKVAFLEDRPNRFPPYRLQEPADAVIPPIPL